MRIKPILVVVERQFVEKRDEVGREMCYHAAKYR
jgi:hypothetical protein